MPRGLEWGIAMAEFRAVVKPNGGQYLVETTIESDNFQSALYRLQAGYGRENVVQLFPAEQENSRPVDSRSTNTSSGDPGFMSILGFVILLVGGLWIYHMLFVG
jgi:hypothetical protein